MTITIERELTYDTVRSTHQNMEFTTLGEIQDTLSSGNPDAIAQIALGAVQIKLTDEI